VRSLPQADAGGGAPGEPGFGHGARVVTAAAIIMISVFAGSFPLRTPSSSRSSSPLGVAVLFDALIIRKTVVPAAMVLLGRSAWWLPRWLDRLLPDVDVDVEGEKLRHPARRRGRIRPVRPVPVREVV
jgi:RND superfamily putative drug exporter